ncbi:hypothetical protein [Dyadobacter arcticus]|uniref:Ribonuclease HII n=1 Tax=Dyadobacter arcticus TaxID=1078754 RepID=A0ABX0ULV1_9BACT|nr:hypothetical protein [Dyadobacter arcticus]NIJ53988.1 ribonuclease HII [Dyadobacter arcticus]
MSLNSEKRRELEEKILSKRQQIDFEKTNIDQITEFSGENNENPDVMEEIKNYDDPADNVVDSAEIKSLKIAENELNELLIQLKGLDQH